MGISSGGFLSSLGMEELREDLEGNEELALVEENSSKEAEQIGDDIEVAVGDMESLGNLKTALESFTSVPDDAAFFARMTVRRVERRYGLRAGAIASMESFDKDSVAISMESIGETLKKFWVMIKEKLQALFKKVSEFFKGFFNYFRRKKEKLNESEERARSGEKQQKNNASDQDTVKTQEPAKPKKDTLTISGKALFRADTGQLKNQDIQPAIAKLRQFVSAYLDFSVASFKKVIRDIEAATDKEMGDVYAALYDNVRKLSTTLALKAIERDGIKGYGEGFIGGFEPTFFTVPVSKEREIDPTDINFHPIDFYNYNNIPDGDKLPETVEIKPFGFGDSHQIIEELKELNSSVLSYFGMTGDKGPSERAKLLNEVVERFSKVTDETKAPLCQKATAILMRHSRDMDNMETEILKTCRFIIETYDKAANDSMDIVVDSFR